MGSQAQFGRAYMVNKYFNTTFVSSCEKLQIYILKDILCLCVSLAAVKQNVLRRHGPSTKMKGQLFEKK